MVPIAIEILLGVTAFFINALLAVLVLSRNIRSWTNRLFFLLAAAINIYIIVNFLSLHPPQPTPESQLFWIRGVMFVTSFLGPILVLLVHTFPSRNITLKPFFVAALLLLMACSATASLLPFVFQDISYPEHSAQPIPIPGIGMPIFILDFVGLFALSFFILIAKYRSTKGIEKTRHLFMLAGIVLSFSLMAFATVISVTFFKISNFIFLGPIFPVILMSFIAYAITKHGIFNLKIFTGQLLIIVLWIILFARIFVPSPFPEKIVDLFIFITSVIVGILTLKSLNTEITHRAQQAAYAELQRLDAAKSEFITIASHQLRTPLSGLKGYIYMAQEGNYGKLPKAMQKTLGNMAIATERLISLADSFLNVSRMQSGKVEIAKKPTDVAVLLTDVVKEIQPRAQEKGIPIVWQAPKKHGAPVLLDQEKMRTVFLGILDNAVRYTKQGSITVTLRHTGKRGVLVSIADTGKGLTAKELADVFVSFTRGKTAQALWTEGVGLSLYIAKQFVEAHNGSIWVTSKGKEQGSVFWVRV